MQLIAALANIATLAAVAVISIAVTARVMQREIDATERALQRECDRADRLETYAQHLGGVVLDMRRDGFVSPPKAEPRTTAQQARSNIEETIALASGGNKQAATMTRAWVASQRAAGIDDEEIQHALLQPLPDEGEGVPV